jgi:hypothetical protein
MRFTDNPMPHLTCNPSTVQIFSVKITEIAGGLQCPLDVFGMISMRDALDHNRNIIFCRTRDNCQSLTQQVLYLFLAVLSNSIFTVNNVRCSLCLTTEHIHVVAD